MFSSMMCRKNLYMLRIYDQVKINGIRLDLQELDPIVMSIEGIVDVISLGKNYNLENKIYTFRKKEDLKLTEESL